MRSTARSVMLLPRPAAVSGTVTNGLPDVHHIALSQMAPAQVSENKDHCQTSPWYVFFCGKESVARITRRYEALRGTSNRSRREHEPCLANKLTFSFLCLFQPCNFWVLDWHITNQLQLPFQSFSNLVAATRITACGVFELPVTDRVVTNTVASTTAATSLDKNSAAAAARPPPCMTLEFVASRDSLPALTIQTRKQFLGEKRQTWTSTDELVCVFRRCRQAWDLLCTKLTRSKLSASRLVSQDKTASSAPAAGGAGSGGPGWQDVSISKDFSASLVAHCFN
ncbi:hypothetical protein IF2G_09619 [Cordyceps javanica]|nr:hypothetical protein IF2G_09619 [Cordyceps javanica]